jgi:hypothetical protein
MPEAARTAEDVDKKFSAPITNDKNSGWPCVIMTDSKEFFGTGKAVRIGGTVDGHEFQATMLPIGGGQHMIPIKAAVRKAIAKEPGDEVIVHIQQRFQ